MGRWEKKKNGSKTGHLVNVRCTRGRESQASLQNLPWAPALWLWEEAAFTQHRKCQESTVRQGKASLPADSGRGKVQGRLRCSLWAPCTPSFFNQNILPLHLKGQYERSQGLEENYLLSFKNLRIVYFWGLGEYNRTILSMFHLLTDLVWSKKSPVFPVLSQSPLDMHGGNI